MKPVPVKTTAGALGLEPLATEAPVIAIVADWSAVAAKFDATTELGVIRIVTGTFNTHITLVVLVALPVATIV